MLKSRKYNKIYLKTRTFIYLRKHCRLLCKKILDIRESQKEIFLAGKRFPVMVCHDKLDLVLKEGFNFDKIFSQKKTKELFSVSLLFLF